MFSKVYQDRINDIQQAAIDSAPVSGLTHTFYRYPARFSPTFARAAINTFTEPGDLIIDPFMGGGTTLVEALSLGRRAIGTDISSLATFISSVKTNLLSDRDHKTLSKWIDYAQEKINLKHKTPHIESSLDHYYQRHTNNSDTWRIRKAILQGLGSLDQLDNERQEQFARCVILRTSQWALDGRKSIPSIDKFRSTLTKHFHDMRNGEIDLHNAARYTAGHTISSARRSIRCIHRSAIGIENERAVRAYDSPKLVITSPPYPGVHVLYHRWQINGGKETPAPFWIANKLDGAGAAYYTMGDRHQKNLTGYFNQIRDAYSSLAEISSDETIVVQMLSFSQPEWQLQTYLNTMEEAGFTEIKPSFTATGVSDRIWRDVPQRKWHANYRGKTQGSKEVVLFHRLK